MRVMDLSALRSFVAVAEHGGVTRAAGVVNLTQSAVSMQVKRLEVQLDLALFERRNRTLVLTSAGEQLLSYARRMLELNDEAMVRLTTEAFEGELTLGVPHDIVYPAIPQVLKEFSKAFPRVKINLVSSYTRQLHSDYALGTCDMILTTEDHVEPGGETLIDLPLVFIGAPGGTAWTERPLRLAFEESCIFRTQAQKALDRASVPWEMAVSSKSTRTIEASVSADLAVNAMIAGTAREGLEHVDHGGALPDLGMQRINLYRSSQCTGPVADDLVGMLRRAFDRLRPSAANAA